MKFREFQPVVRMFEDDDWNFIKTWKFTKCLKKKKCMKVEVSGQGRAVQMCRDGERSVKK